MNITSFIVISLTIQVALLFLFTDSLRAADKSGAAEELWLRPYVGPTRTDIDATTVDGKVLCGYQGWFNTPGRHL